MKHLFWTIANAYGRVFGRGFLAPFHHGVVILSLHALGYDNAWRGGYSGETWFIHHVLKRHDVRVCIDVGANVGDYSRELLAAGSRVYAFEPSAETFAQLVQVQQEYPNFFPIQKAVGDVVGQAELFSVGKSATKSLNKEVLGEASIESVQVTTLDAFVREAGLERVDFIKVDTEGHEWEVLLGMQHSLTTLHPKFIQFEFNIMHLKRGHTLLQLTGLLAGYEFYRLLPAGWVKINPRSFIDNVYMFCNIVAVRKE